LSYRRDGGDHAVGDSFFENAISEEDCFLQVDKFGGGADGAIFKHNERARVDFEPKSRLVRRSKKSEYSS
jgi:hypothetical protein